MLLAIDVGNTHVVIGTYQGPEITNHWRINTNRHSTSDELAATFHALFSQQGLEFAEISSVIIASVVPPMQHAWHDFIRRYLDQEPMQVDNRLDFGMQVLTDNPAEVGADRIVNGVAAYQRYKSSLIIVDLGTAITFDCISSQGDYLGGVITPGIAIAIDALGQRTAKLPRIDISSPPEKIIGTNTVAAIKSGILHGYGGLIEGLISKIKSEFAPECPKVIATGGMAGIIAPYAPSIESVQPLLTLEGLRLLHERNQ